MDFRFTDDQLTLAEGVRDFLAGTHGPDVLRRLDAAAGVGGSPRDPAIWQALVDMGLPALLVPEAQGGLGLGLVEAALIAVECGRVCLAEPLVETAFVGVPWLRKQGADADLEAIAAGARLAAPAHQINGWVSDGEGAPLQSVDPLRCLSIADKPLSNDPYLLDLGALMAAAQLVGLADAMLAQATEYAKIRTQFGQPIGAFQAIKHQLASVAVAVEFAKPVVWRAAAALQDDLASASLHVSHAKVAATDAAMLASETAIQVHGAMGYTYEVDLHFWMKRTWALAGAWGARAYHMKRIDDAVIGGTHPTGPEHTFA